MPARGHRRNMLSSSSQTFAVGHVVYNGVHFLGTGIRNKPGGGNREPGQWRCDHGHGQCQCRPGNPENSAGTGTRHPGLDQGTELPLVDVTMTLKDTAKGLLGFHTPGESTGQLAGRFQGHCEGGGQSGDRPPSRHHHPDRHGAGRSGLSGCYGERCFAGGSRRHAESDPVYRDRQRDPPRRNGDPERARRWSKMPIILSRMPTT